MSTTKRSRKISGAPEEGVASERAISAKQRTPLAALQPASKIAEGNKTKTQPAEKTTTNGKQAPSAVLKEATHDNKKKEEKKRTSISKVSTKPQWEYGEMPKHPKLPKQIADPTFGLDTLELYTQSSTLSLQAIHAQFVKNFPSKRVTSFEDYANIIQVDQIPWPQPRARIPELSKTWKEDGVFAAQFLRGVNPVMLTRAAWEGPRTIPSALTTPFDGWMSNVAKMEAFLYAHEGHHYCSFHELVDEGRLFFVDYSMLKQTRPKAGSPYIFYAPTVLLYESHRHLQLMPLAIQLESRPASEIVGNEIFLPPTPNLNGDIDPIAERTWLFAKIHTMHADTLVHQIHSHLLSTHLAIEPVIIAANRVFHKDHPLFQVLQDHFVGTIETNNLRRKIALSKTEEAGKSPKKTKSSKPSFSFSFDALIATGLKNALTLMEKEYRKSWALMNFPVQMEKRGFKYDDDPLPGYYYREDGARAWHALEWYSFQAVAALYANDQAVQHDQQVELDLFQTSGDQLICSLIDQLQKWIFELKSKTGADVPGIPTVQNRNELMELLASILFTVTAQHAAMNAGQFESYAFQPFRPISLTKAMPVQHHRAAAFATDNFILSALPTIDQARQVALTAYRMITPTGDLVQADGHAAHRLWTMQKSHSNRQVVEAFQDFQARLRILREEIRARNIVTGIMYTALLPNNFPCSVTI